LTHGSPKEYIKEETGTNFKILYRNEGVVINHPGIFPLTSSALTS